MYIIKKIRFSLDGRTLPELNRIFLPLFLMSSSGSWLTSMTCPRVISSITRGNSIHGPISMAHLVAFLLRFNKDNQNNSLLMACVYTLRRRLFGSLKSTVKDWGVKPPHLLLLRTLPFQCLLQHRY